MNTARIMLWGKRTGYVSWDSNRSLATFRYDPNLVRHGIEISPLKMPLGKDEYEFPELERRTFKGLPGMAEAARRQPVAKAGDSTHPSSRS